MLSEVRHGSLARASDSSSPNDPGSSTRVPCSTLVDPWPTALVRMLPSHRVPLLLPTHPLLPTTSPSHRLIYGRIAAAPSIRLTPQRHQPVSMLPIITIESASMFLTGLLAELRAHTRRKQHTCPFPSHNCTVRLLRDPLNAPITCIGAPEAILCSRQTVY